MKSEKELNRLFEMAGWSLIATGLIQQAYDLGKLDGQLEVHEQERERLKAELAEKLA